MTVSKEDWRYYRCAKAAAANDREKFNSEGGTQAEWDSPLFVELRGQS